MLGTFQCLLAKDVRTYFDIFFNVSRMFGGLTYLRDFALIAFNFILEIFILYIRV